MKIIKFIKMQSLGNDFVIIDQLKNPYKFSKNQIKEICDRNYGIGCDQLLNIRKSSKLDISFEYKIYNKDGSESGQCGNGAKCIAKYFFDKYKTRKKEIKIETKTRKLVLRKYSNKNIEVDMGIPNINYNKLDAKISKFIYKGKKYLFSSVSIGNPHAVFLLKSIKGIDLEDFANKFNKKNFFKNGVNISLVENIMKNNWRARIYERGSGETMACGSASCAISACLPTLAKDIYINNYVHMQGGKAQVKWSGKTNEPIYLIGSAEYVYSGQYKI